MMYRGAGQGPMGTDNSPLFRERYFDISEIAADGKDRVFQFEHIKAKSNFAGFRVKDSSFWSSDLIEYWQHHRFQLTLAWLPVSLAAGESAYIALGDIQNLWDEMMPNVEDELPTAAYTPTLSDYRPGDDDDSPIWQPGKLTEKLLTNPATAAVIQQWRPTLGFFNNSAFRPGVGPKADGTLVNTNRVQTLWQIPENWIRVGISPPTNGYLVWAITNPAQPAAYTQANMSPRGAWWESLNFLTKVKDKLTGTSSILPSTTQDWRAWAMSFVYDVIIDAAAVTASKATGQMLDDRVKEGKVTQWLAADINFRLEVIAYYEQQVIGITADGGTDNAGATS